MKYAVRKIDEALKSLYQLDLPYQAENFLLKKSDTSVSSLLLKQEGEDLSVGIYFTPKVREDLSDFKRWDKSLWNLDQKNAFATASEEISHFLYFLFNSSRGRAISQFELELQAEIDKFFLFYFSDQNHCSSEKFDKHFDTVFEKFRWAEGLGEEEKQRYIEANHLAKRFVLGVRDLATSKEGVSVLLDTLRKYYRMGNSDRVSYIYKKI